MHATHVRKGSGQEQELLRRGTLAAPHVIPIAQVAGRVSSASTRDRVFACLDILVTPLSIAECVLHVLQVHTNLLQEMSFVNYVQAVSMVQHRQPQL